MRCPFPGMDPFFEGQNWEDFHASFIGGVRDDLVSALRPRYVVAIENTVYLVREDETVENVRVPDIHLAPATSDIPDTDDSGGGTATATAARSVVLTLPRVRPVRQKRLRIVRKDDLELVTIIEVLSPWNKAGEGRAEYLRKRAEIVASQTHLVELDLLRGGDRLPMVEPLPDGDYFAFVARSSQRPRVRVFPWGWKERLPTIPIPLAAGDADCPLDLQHVFATVYERAGYDYALDHTAAVLPPLNAADESWVRKIVERPNAAPTD